MQSVLEFAGEFLTQVNRDDDADIPSMATAITSIIESWLDVHEVQILGGGSFGTAAAISGNEVLKLTTDPSEVETSTVLMNVPAERYPANVVRITGAWFLRRIRVVALKDFDPETEDETVGQVRVGLIRMERVQQLQDMEAMRGLATWTRFVKDKYEVWPGQLQGLPRKKQRDRMLAAGQEMERMLMNFWRQDGKQVARDVALGIAQLRAEGIYGTDFHGGNVGYVWLREQTEKPEHFSQKQTFSQGPTVSVPTKEMATRENPLTEETLSHLGVKYDLITFTRDRAYHYVRISYGKQWGPFDSREEAIGFAHAKIDEQFGAPQSEDRIYKLFDIGQSSIPMDAPRPSQMPPPPPKKRGTVSLVGEKVRVAELG